MKKILTVIGARPQIIKSAAVSRAISQKFPDQLKEIILHTGQHYDENMSHVFFEEMSIPKPDVNLQVGSGAHGSQTARMIEGIEIALNEYKPDALLVYGDTNSTLAGAIAAAKIHVPVVHVESGLRSFNKRMPEEINRITCDHCSTLLFTPTDQGVVNLKAEGFTIDAKGPYTMDNPGAFRCGDVMYDNSLYFEAAANEQSSVLKDLGVEENEFILATVHRNNNTDIPERLNAIFKAFLEIANSSDKKIVLPLHPRTKNLLSTNLDASVKKSMDNCSNLVLTTPVSFLDMVMLESKCSMVLTDSGGVQKEAFFFKKPCVILRSETEWVELVKNGNAIIADADENKIIDAYRTLSEKLEYTYPAYYGKGDAAEFICDKILTWL
jgi:UDP-GlcNAc3NAcA epimerase